MEFLSVFIKFQFKKFFLRFRTAESLNYENYARGLMKLNFKKAEHFYKIKSNKKYCCIN